MISQTLRQSADNFLLPNLSIVPVLGVKITNASRSEAIACLEELILQKEPSTNGVFLVNAHTLNLATENPSYRYQLNGARYVFGDGTGVRWAARLRGVTMKSNLVGTDLIPELFQATANRGYRYFLLGADPETIQRAAGYTQKKFPGWELAGFHHGYLDRENTAAVIAQINAAKPDLLLVGMGNPLQEAWIDRHQFALQVPVCVGVGGLFDHWGGNLKRAPRWVRQLGFEWLQLLLQQPKKWKRYLIGNPKFLIQILLTLGSDSKIMRASQVRVLRSQEVSV